MTILALDLGNEFGWAVKEFGSVNSGFHKLTIGKCDPGKKFIKFMEWLEKNSDCVSLIVYEDVVRHCSKFNARAYCGYLAILQSYCYTHDIKCEGVGVKTVKKFWAGNGNAKKEMMIQKANERGFDVINDNEADALALLHYVIDNKL